MKASCETLKGKRRLKPERWKKKSLAGKPPNSSYDPKKRCIYKVFLGLPKAYVPKIYIGSLDVN